MFDLAAAIDELGVTIVSLEGRGNCWICTYLPEEANCASKPIWVKGSSFQEVLTKIINIHLGLD